MPVVELTIHPPYPGKRLLDIALALALLLLCLPLAGVVALAIKLLDGGPALFWQQRVGRGGRPFAFPKFRSMVTDAEARRADLEAHNRHGHGQVPFKMENDPRVTRFGRFIRKHSIDELPQLWCVLTGDMSMVGPRPPTVDEVEKYTPHQRQRLAVTPGVTGLWQVSGRSDLSFAQQVDLDLEYARRQSLFLDLAILWRTVPAVITGRGAY